MNYLKRKHLKHQLTKVNCKIVSLEMRALDGENIEAEYNKLVDKQKLLAIKLGYKDQK